MMNLFKMKMRNNERRYRGYRLKVLSAISSHLQRGHDKLAAYMNRKASGLSSRTMKVCLCLFCLLFGSACLYVLLASILK